LAHPQHEEVRQRYDYCCGYCGVSETDTGGELTVDHYHPVSRGGEDSDDNLVYACMRCNLHKSDTLQGEAEADMEQRILHPLRDNVSEHLRENHENGLLEPLTATGEFHIRTLRLNRPALVAHRRRRNLESLEAQQVRLVKLSLADVRARLAVQNLLILHLLSWLVARHQEPEE
jgi:hypothetical protein